MRLQENFEFLQKGNASMMFFLSLDVTVDLGQHRLTHRERAVSFLPLESRAVLECSRDPAGGIRFQFTNQLRDRLVLSQLCQDVNVVSGSVDDHRDSFFVANRAAEVLMRPRADFWREPRFASLCRKDDVIQQIAIGGTHLDADFRRPLPGLLSFRIIHPEFRYAPLRALGPAHPPGALAARWHRGRMERELEMNKHVQRSHWGFVPALIVFSAGGAKEYSPEWSAAELREAVRKNFRTPGKG
jgi:hypothetical protein